VDGGLGRGGGRGEVKKKKDCRQVKDYSRTVSDVVTFLLASSSVSNLNCFQRLRDNILVLHQ
jgi:hypothetical protein